MRERIPFRPIADPEADVASSSPTVSPPRSHGSPLGCNRHAGGGSDAAIAAARLSAPPAGQEPAPRAPTSRGRRRTSRRVSGSCRETTTSRPRRRGRASSSSAQRPCSDRRASRTRAALRVLASGGRTARALPAVIDCEPKRTSRDATRRSGGCGPRATARSAPLPTSHREPRLAVALAICGVSTTFSNPRAPLAPARARRRRSPRRRSHPPATRRRAPLVEDRPARVVHEHGGRLQSPRTPASRQGRVSGFGAMRSRRRRRRSGARRVAPANVPRAVFLG